MLENGSDRGDHDLAGEANKPEDCPDNREGEEHDECLLPSRQLVVIPGEAEITLA